MSRSAWKGPFLDNFLFKSTEQLQKNQKVWSRRSVIPASLMGSVVLVYNGREFKRVAINRERIGFKFGEFSFTRKHTKKEKPNKQVAKKKK
jgi:small subunit ribosomal protein S19